MLFKSTPKYLNLWICSPTFSGVEGTLQEDLLFRYLILLFILKTANVLSYQVYDVPAL